jgi:hypothetical protein
MIDRGEAVNLARNWLDDPLHGITDNGIDALAKAVLAMDADISAQSEAPLMVGGFCRDRERCLKEAGRYHWLKTNAVHVSIVTEKQSFCLYGKDLDAVIDMASASLPQPDGETQHGARALRGKPAKEPA